MKRPESGPMQFGDDWPGLFIRGDNAIMFGQAIESAMKLIEEGKQIGVYNYEIIMALKEELLGVNVVRNPNPTKLKPFEECLEDGES